MTKLRVVVAGETPPVEPPKTMAEAAERTRREFLVRSRLQIATAIDGGVPAHALGRLIAEMDRLDAEIRRLDSLSTDEGGVSKVTDGDFDAQAV